MKQLSNGMGMRFFGGKILNSFSPLIINGSCNQVHLEILVTEVALASLGTLQTSFPREQWASLDLTQVTVFITHHCCHLDDLSGLVPGMEQPLPMSGGCINPDQFSLPPR